MDKEEVIKKLGFGSRIILPDGTPLRILHIDYINQISGSFPVLVKYLETCSRIEEGIMCKQDGLTLKLNGRQDWIPVKIENDLIILSGFLSKE